MKVALSYKDGWGIVMLPIKQVESKKETIQ
ncbi:Uncharacterised protein [Lysinibacillus sphaericus]|uniref:Uncharacterized protein n=1 Tax=Lysinibacillus sphaericus TaxID=1421 RepID=A0AAJ5DA46_LYSSH|nr:Uncharacterised protein [Lysinibacillus sphaericus]